MDYGDGCGCRRRLFGVRRIVNMKNIFQMPKIAGICAALPKETVVLRDLAGLYGEKTIEHIIKSTGIEQVRIAPKEKTTADYCLEAANQLFKELPADRAQVDGVIFVSQTPDYILPSTSSLLQDRLGLSKRLIAMDLNYGCSGYVYGLFQAFLLIESGYCKNVLLFAGDTLGRYIHEKDRALRMVMGDAASATLVVRGEEKSEAAFSFYTDGAGARHLIIPAGANRRPAVPGITDQEISDEDGNIRTMEHLYMNGLEILGFVLGRVPKTVAQVLNKIGWKKEDADLFVFHQANALIVKCLIKQMKIEEKRTPIRIAETGNTSAASIPLALCGLSGAQKDRLKHVVLCGFGVGLSCVAAAMSLEHAFFFRPRDY